MTHHKSHHKVGLGSHFLNRAIIIFIVLLLLTLATTGTAIYADYKAGFFKKNIVEPVWKFFSEVSKSFEESTTPDLTDIELIATKSGSININIQTGGSTEEKYYTPKTNYNYEFKYLTPDYYTPYSTPLKPAYLTPYGYPTPLKSYDQLLKEQEEWSKQKQTENQAWYDQKVKESQKELEEWKKAHGF